MKKLFTLLLCAALSMPAFAAGIATGPFTAKEQNDENYSKVPECRSDGCYVSFVNNRANLPADLETKLKSLIKEQGWSADCTSFRVIGFTDRSASVNYNVNLAKARAEYVKGMIETVVGNSATIDVAGESDATANNNPDGYANGTFRLAVIAPISRCNECDISVVGKCMEKPACAGFLANYSEVAEECVDGNYNNNSDFIEKYNTLVDALLSNGCCGPELEPEIREEKEKIEIDINIEKTKRKMESLIASLGNRSVWRTTEGTFNTARLVSDSVAGVVLGTAGGLITSHIIKKNQIKGGFEDLNCAIGGQTVAGWGDEFRVGLK